MYSYYALTFMCVGSCMCHAQATPVSKLRRRRDRINLGFWRSLYKGGGVMAGGEGTVTWGVFGYVPSGGGRVPSRATAYY